MGSHAVAGSGGEVVGNMVDANDERWGKLFVLSTMAVDTRAEWSEGPSAKKRCRAPPTCTLCGMTGHNSNNTSRHPKT